MLPPGIGNAAMPSMAFGTLSTGLAADTSMERLTRTTLKPSGMCSSGQSVLGMSGPYPPLPRGRSLPARAESRRLIWPAPTPMVMPPLQKTMAFDLTYLATFQANRRSCSSSGAGCFLVTTFRSASLIQGFCMPL